VTESCTLLCGMLLVRRYWGSDDGTPFWPRSTAAQGDWADPQPLQSIHQTRKALCPIVTAAGEQAHAIIVRRPISR
jgi:hypothetical protein